MIWFQHAMFGEEGLGASTHTSAQSIEILLALTEGNKWHKVFNHKIYFLCNTVPYDIFSSSNGSGQKQESLQKD